MQNIMPISPSAFKPINSDASTATGCIPRDEETILGSIICLITETKI